ncbi:O-antigen ligase family protein [Acuticoccus yangtzensis]|uniref:O-antigen ligase family protein n=1 Tax=Acuticoccus yangtzensis TaxID=1443441 RepID=UPI0009497905|nr:O-antigen ligase family protein [Acuticoccus yangtzensis]
MATGTWLDDLTPDRETRNRQRAALGNVIVLWAGRLLMAAVFFVVFVGFHPLSRDLTGGASGNIQRQLSFISLALIAMPIILMRWGQALRTVAGAWHLWLVLAALGATALWSNFPDVTVRRLILMMIIAVVGLGLAVSLNRPRDYMIAIGCGFGFILAFDMVLAVAMPSFAYDALGLAGLHPQKNVAGMAGLMFVSIFVSLLFGLRHPAAFWTVAFMLVLSLVFLFLTNSKTSLGIALISAVIAAPAFALAHRGLVFASMLGLGLVVAVGIVVFATGTFHLSGADWAEMTTGDPTFTGRDQIWAASVQEIAKAPLLGHGFGAVWSMLPLFHPLGQYVGFWTDSYDTLLAINQSHNGYLDLLMHGGLFLFVIVMIFILKIIKTMIQTFRSTDRWAIAGNVFVGTFLLNTLLNNMMESTIFFPDGLLGTFLILVALAQVSWSKHRI